VLVLLPQMPHDPASGASRTVATIAELLAGAGFEVRMVATTATERYAPLDGAEWLAGQGIAFVREGRVLRFVRREVSCALLDTGTLGVTRALAAHAAEYDALVDAEAVRLRPEIVFTYGASGAEVARQRRLRRAGARLVFGLYNTRYAARGFFDHADAVITPSAFLSAYYRDRIALQSTPLPTPLWPGDVIAVQRRPSSVTMVNASLEKGLVVFAAIVRLLAASHPHIPIDVVLGREDETFVRQAAYLTGADFDAHPHLTLTRHASALPRAIFQSTRVLLVPSLVEDAAPRVVAEALVNGAVPIGSDRGGIPEMCAGAGFVVPVPRSITSRDLTALPSSVVQPWVERIVSLFTDAAAWREASERATIAGRAYLPPEVTDAYVSFFTRVLRPG
jgi:glycosyltransferase involved in cell wall biosynthesis